MDLSIDMQGAHAHVDLSIEMAKSTYTCRSKHRHGKEHIHL